MSLQHGISLYHLRFFFDLIAVYIKSKQYIFKNLNFLINRFNNLLYVLHILNKKEIFQCRTILNTQYVTFLTGGTARLVHAVTTGTAGMTDVMTAETVVTIMITGVGDNTKGAACTAPLNCFCQKKYSLIIYPQSFIISNKKLTAEKNLRCCNRNT